MVHPHGARPGNIHNFIASQVGDTSRPPSSLVEASSRRLANFQSRKEADKKETQRGVVKRFMNATAKAFAEENPMYVNDPSVSGLLHDDIILITYDKMKFFGKKIVQKKINSGECSHHYCWRHTQA